MMRWLQRLWWARQRKIDLQVLWPVCKDGAQDLDHARAAFMHHAAQDPAWAEYYGDRLPDAIERFCV